MKLIGKPPINPIIFYSGKVAGYAVWLVLLIELISITGTDQLSIRKSFALLLTGISFVIIVVSLINLGSSTSLGLPQENTEIRTGGLYKISRNPMYLGFNILSLSAILYINSFIILIFGIYSIITYHLIILAEEKFLEDRFGNGYLEYKSKVRRYI
ncbi:MAG: isoprenylcysteine carboxylmethyltransferase family protein [Anaerolineae bacterium]|jgi:protein-S-isoprenylcysteine O-methyltransferase Ste14|nr:isoprenylcysteine carboxylmethyltransferase family protein [Anaerolineae bacterium]